MSTAPIVPQSFRIGDVAKIIGLVDSDEKWNGEIVIIKSKPYLHKSTGCLAINIEMNGTQGFALSPWNLMKLDGAEYDAYVDHRYLDPNGNGQPYDGNVPTTWDQCVWQPKLET